MTLIDYVIEWIASVPPVLEFVVLLAAALAAGTAIWKMVIKPIWHFTKRVDSGMDALLGYAAVVDPATGRELQGETPSMATRVYRLEESQAQIAEAITMLAKLQERIDQRDAKYDAWIEKHEAEAADRELRLHAWEEWRSEQTSMWELVRTHMAADAQNTA